MIRVVSPIDHFGRALGSLPFVHPMVDYIHKSSRSDTEVSKQRRVTEFDIQDINTWYQTFGSTAKIFGGLGGSAMTTALMVVVKTNWYYIVFCDGNAVYMVPYKEGEGLKSFQADLQKKDVVSLRHAPDRYKAEVAPDYQEFYKSLIVKKLVASVKVD